MKGEIIKEHDRVVLKVDLPAEGLKAGDVGTVVHLYRDGLAYEVEFTTLSGDTAAVVTVQKSPRCVRFANEKSRTPENCRPRNCSSRLV